MRIAILNTHSVLNTGDAAIVTAQFDLVREVFPGARIALTSRTAAIDRKAYEAWDVEVFPPLIPAPSVFSRQPDGAARMLAETASPAAKSRLLRCLADADLVIGSGGGYFWTGRRRFPGPMFLQNILHVKIASWMKKPLVHFPQSFGPVSGSAARLILKNALQGPGVRKIFAREHESLSFLNKLLAGTPAGARVDICPDAVFLEAPTGSRRPEPRDRPGPLVAVTPRRWNFPGLPREEARDRGRAYLEALERACSEIVQRLDASILVLPWVRGPGRFEDDRDIAFRLYRRLKTALPENRTAYSGGSETDPPGAVMDRLARADLVIATRFHSALLALLRGIPVVSIAYQPKSASMLRSLGLDKYSLDIGDLSPERIAGLAGEALAESGAIADRMRVTAEKMRGDARTKLKAGMVVQAGRETP